MKLRSAYAKMFNLPAIDQKKVNLAGKFLNISCVLYDKTGAVQVDPYKQQTNVTNNVLDLVAEPRKISANTAITILYIAYHGNMKLSANLNNYVLQWGKMSATVDIASFVGLISKLNNPMTFCKILHKYGILKKIFPWLKAGIRKVDEETGNRLCNDSLPKDKYKFLYTYLIVLGDSVKYNIPVPNSIVHHVKFVRVIKNSGAKGRDVVELFKTHNLNHYSEDFIHTLADIVESMRIVDEHWAVSVFRFYDEYYKHGFCTHISNQTERMKYCDAIAKKIYTRGTNEHL